MKKMFLVTALLTLMNFTFVIKGQNAPSQNGWSIAENCGYVYSEEMVEGGDGYNLFTRIYLPDNEGPYPVVVTRTPYAYGTTTGDNLAIGQAYAKRGLGYIQQYCRGKGGSEGKYIPNEYERADGLALLYWLEEKPWCKSIGVFGSSYVAFTGWILGDSLPEKVKGMYLAHYGVDRHISLYKDGLFRQDIMTSWAIDNASEPIVRPKRTNPDEPYYEQYRYMPQLNMDVDLLGAELPWYRNWITNTDYADLYWNQGYWGLLKSIPAKVNVPVTVVAGLYDHHLEGTLLGYERLNKEIKKNSRLVLGAWTHGFQTNPVQHNPLHAKDFDVNADQFNWLYSVVVNGVVPKGEVKVYLIEDDKWLTFDSWPIKFDREEKYYFTKIATKDPKAFLLSDKKQKESDKIEYIYDPLNPVISNGGETLFASVSKLGSKLQKEIGYRNDVISFVTEPLKENLIITGKIKVKLTVSTNVDDTSFSVTISEVMPDGKTYNIRNGITTLAYRNNPLGNRQIYTPKSVEGIEILTVPVTWDVKAGNAIRVDISSSNFPEYSVHSNYAGAWAEQTKTRKANQTIYLGGENETSITFPTKKL